MVVRLWDASYASRDMGRHLQRASVGLTIGVLLAAVALTPIHANAAGCISRASTSPSPSPQPLPTEGPLYPMGDQIYTIDHDVTLFYYFQGNRDGTAKVKKEFRYDRNLWNTCAQLQIRLPFITRYPTGPKLPYSPNGDPYSGFGNAELRYMYSVPTDTFDHTITVGVAFPTQSNGVESIDTELKLFYTTKWKWSGGALAYMNEYDQTIIRPPGADNVSYYEGELTVPYYSFVDSPAWKGLKISASYSGRLFFNGGPFKSAVGGIINGNINDVALSVRDTWGVGANALWKYKVEANATVRLNF